MLNYILVGHLSNIILSFPQFIIVIAFILKRDYKNAVFFHLLFIVTSISAVRAMLSRDVTMFSYSQLKAYSVIGVYQIISIILFILIRIKYPNPTITECKNTLFYRFRNIVAYLGISATVIGIIGLIFSDYIGTYFMKNIVYMGFLFIHIDMLLRCINDTDFKKLMFENSICLLIAAPIAIFFCFSILRIGTSYGGIDSVIMQSELSYFAIALLLLLLYSKNIAWIVIALLCLSTNLLSSGRGGELMLFFVGIIIFLFVLFSKKNSFEQPKRKKKLAVLFLCLVPVIITYYSYISVSQLTEIKFQQLTSLFNVFSIQNNFNALYDIGSSPYIRVAEVLNIIDNGFNNFLFLLFGHGYGGYFTDSLHLFSGLDLTGGAFSYEVVASGHFTSAHSVYPSALLFNGIIGLFLLLQLGIKYIKRIKMNFLSFAAIPLFFYGFYFNLQLALTSVFILFASEYNYSERKNSTLNV
jgi:hypothetical protein